MKIGDRVKVDRNKELNHSFLEYLDKENRWSQVGTVEEFASDAGYNLVYVCFDDGASYWFEQKSVIDY